MNRTAVIIINALLVLTIIGVILATWMPVIYTSAWFQSHRWAH
jgi:hypothetical protein